MQSHYNLVERDFERTLLPVADAWDLTVVPYYGLAKGFLTGLDRPGGEAVESARAEAARPYLDRGGITVQLEQILPAATLELTPAEVDRLSGTTRGGA